MSNDCGQSTPQNPEPVAWVDPPWLENPKFVVNTGFHKFHTENDGTIYWRSCVLSDDMKHGEQGYLWVFEDGRILHSYRRPDMCFNERNDNV